MMKRNPQSVIQALNRVLEVCPHLRVGQAIANALPECYEHDPFYINDELLAEALLDLAHKLRESKST